MMLTTRFKLSRQLSLVSLAAVVALLGSLWVLIPAASAEEAGSGDAPAAVECPGVTSAPVPGLGEGAPEVKTAHCGCSKGYSQGGCAKCNGIVPPTPVGDADSNATTAPAAGASGCGCQGGK
jgi:hypothetical protein